MDDKSVVVIGGGPAGLSAALCLARYARPVTVIDAGQGRSTHNQVNHNYLGFPGGIAARELRERGLQQLSEYAHVAVRTGKVTSLRSDGAGFVAKGQFGNVRASGVIICTGVLDHYPHFDGWNDYVGVSMHWCITCDGYESRDQRIVVLGATDVAACEALQLRRFSENVTLLYNTDNVEPSPSCHARLRNAGIEEIDDELVGVDGDDGQVRAILTKAGRKIEADRIFVVQGSTPLADLAEQVGADLREDGYVQVDADQRTSVPLVYAAGDLTAVHGHQVSAAVHQGAQAASAANFDLYPPELRTI